MPPHLQLTLLNVPPALDATAALPRPQHVVLNHLYCQRAPSSVNALVVGTTTRCVLHTPPPSFTALLLWAVVFLLYTSKLSWQLSQHAQVLRRYAVHTLSLLQSRPH